MQNVIANAAKHDLNLHQLDISTALLNGKLKEEIYMKQPERFEIKDKKKDLVCKPKRNNHQDVGMKHYQFSLKGCISGN